MRVFNLPDLDPVFIELIAHPAVALGVVCHLLTDDCIIPNVTANIANPRSGFMVIRSHLAAVSPRSHRYQRTNQLPEDIVETMVPMAVEAGCVIAMDGRIWHTFGEDRTAEEERAPLFGDFSRSFVRPQWTSTWDCHRPPGRR